MSITVVKAGINDTIQDEGRVGYAAFGINHAGVMDKLALHTANALLGNPLDTAVIEMHFPAATLFFEQDALIALSGADFNASIQSNGNDALHFDINKTAYIKAGSTLSFTHKEFGEWCYLAVHGGFALDKWMGSHATQLAIAQGGYEGRRLKKSDRLSLNKNFSDHFPETKIFSWMAGLYTWYHDTTTFNIITGPEWDWMEPRSQKHFLSQEFVLSAQSDRMGSRLEGLPLSKNDEIEMISSGVSFGTIQLLPNGQMIVLMADHPTTGGYPRIANIIAAHLPKLAQTAPGTAIRFGNTSLATAENLLMVQHKELEQLQSAVKLQLGIML